MLNLSKQCLKFFVQAVCANPLPGDPKQVSFSFKRGIMSYEHNVKVSVLAILNGMDFEDRDSFVRSHRYDAKNSNHFVLNTEGLKREKAINRYYPHYTVDNYYEYCVFRNLITLLNQYGRMLKPDGSPTRRAFTLGHWKPLVKGGEHHAANWVIQTQEDNNKAGEKLPEQDYKWSLKEQIDYIMSKINFNFVDESKLQEMQKYIMMLGKVYNGK